MLDFVEKKICYYSNAIIEGTDKIDELAYGELKFYITLRRVLNGRATHEDKGFVDAINDTLQEANIIDRKETFLSKLK